MSLKLTKSIEWDGRVLTGWITIDGKTVKVSAARQIIHQYAFGWSDAVTWEIERHREEIFNKLLPFFKAQQERIKDEGCSSPSAPALILKNSGRKRPK